MSIAPRADWYRRFVTFGLVAVSAVVLWGCGGGDGGGSSQPQAIPLTVPKATCGPTDNPESALQGQVPAALRASGFKGFNCNLSLVAQSKGEGASWQHAWFQDKAGHNCNYYDTSSPVNGTANRTNLGTVVLDTSNASTPTPTAYLTTLAMLDPWESLKVKERRRHRPARSLRPFGGLQKASTAVHGCDRNSRKWGCGSASSGADFGWTRR